MYARQHRGRGFGQQTDCGANPCTWSDFFGPSDACSSFMSCTFGNAWNASTASAEQAFQLSLGIPPPQVSQAIGQAVGGAASSAVSGAVSSVSAGIFGGANSDSDNSDNTGFCQSLAGGSTLGCGGLILAVGVLAIIAFSYVGVKR